MADTNADRQRRYRLHKKGDHSLCDSSRCRDRGYEPPISVVPATAAEPPAVDEHVPGGIERAVTSFVVGLAYEETDPRSILGEIAVQLARRVDESGALPAAVRELRVLLAQIAEVPNAPSGELDEVRVQRARRRLDSLIAKAG